MVRLSILMVEIGVAWLGPVIWMQSRIWPFMASSAKRMVVLLGPAPVRRTFERLMVMGARISSVAAGSWTVPPCGGRVLMSCWMAGWALCSSQVVRVAVWLLRLAKAAASRWTRLGERSRWSGRFVVSTLSQGLGFCEVQAARMMVRPRRGAMASASRGIWGLRLGGVMVGGMRGRIDGRSVGTGRMRVVEADVAQLVRAEDS